MTGMSDGFGNCSKVFRFWWFVFAFVIAVLLGLLITTATHMGLHFSRPFWCVLQRARVLRVRVCCARSPGLGVRWCTC
jgi:hypothetical protein